MTLGNRYADKSAKAAIGSGVAMPVQDQHLPAELKSECRWVVWRAPSKAPLRATSGTSASSTDQATWSEFSTAREAIERDPQLGLGFVLTGHSSLVALDLDACRDPVTGEVAAWAEELMADANSYTEYSPSGTGLHIIGSTELSPHAKVVLPVSAEPMGGTKQPQIELYLRPPGGQFITLTGWVRAGYERLQRIDPAFLQELLNRRQSEGRAPAAVIKPVFGAKVPHGQRHDYLVRRAVSLRRLGVTERDILTVLQASRERECEAGGDPVDDEELRGIACWSSAVGSEAQEAQPVDLLAPFKPPALPIDALPPVLAAFALHQARYVGVDPAGPGLLALAVCAAVIPDFITLQPKVYDEGWREAARPWIAIVAPPSGKKSPALAAALRPLRQLELRIWAEYQGALQSWEEMKDQDPRPPEPVARRLIINSATSEAAGLILGTNPDGVLLVSDELSGWFGALEKYSKGRGAQAERAFWLQSWNGGQYFVDRASRQSLRIPNLSVSIIGGIQPGPLQAVLADANEDGLLQRFLFVCLRPANMGVDEPDRGQAVWAYEQAVDSLWDYGETLRGKDVPPVRLGGAAQEIRRHLSRMAHDLAAAEGMDARFAAWCGKLDGQFARLLLVYHCLESNDPVAHLVEESTAKSLFRLFTEFLIPHAYAVFMGDDHALDHRRRIAGLILAKEWARVTARDLSRYDKQMRAEPRLIAETMAALELCGWVVREEEVNPRAWRVDPLVHQLFAEHAGLERARRAANLSLLREAVGRPQGEEA